MEAGSLIRADITAAASGPEQVVESWAEPSMLNRPLKTPVVRCFLIFQDSRCLFPVFFCRRDCFGCGAAPWIIKKQKESKTPPSRPILNKYKRNKLRQDEKEGTRCDSDVHAEMSKFKIWSFREITNLMNSFLIVLVIFYLQTLVRVKNQLFDLITLSLLICVPLLFILKTSFKHDRGHRSSRRSQTQRPRMPLIKKSALFWSWR